MLLQFCFRTRNYVTFSP